MRSNVCAIVVLGKKIKNKNVLKLNYNEFVNNPEDTMIKVYDFLEIHMNDQTKKKIIREVHQNSLNKKYINLGSELEMLINNTNKLHLEFCKNKNINNGKKY